MKYPPDQFAREQIIMADNAVNSIIEAAISGSLTIPREAFAQFLKAALAVDPMTSYVRANNDSWSDYVRDRERNNPIIKNFNASNDEEIGR